jgi:hypothetical protein
MAFLYAKQFPAGCVVETDSDPAELRLGGTQYYPVGVSLTQAMAWIWISRAFTGYGSSQILSECCNNDPVYGFYDFPKSQSTSGVDAAKKKMSELICPDSYVTDFTFFGTLIANNCNGTNTYGAEAGFGFFINDPNAIFESPIYLYKKKYYIAIGYGVGGGLNLSEDVNRTYFAGNFTIDKVDFPLYSRSPECNDVPQANFSCTTTLEREAN